MIEMLVVLGIIIVVTAVILTGQSTYNQSLLLSDTAYTLALSIRETQSLGLSSRKFSTIQNAGYGVQVTSATPDRYQLFADIVPLAPGNSQGGACPGHAVTTGPEARPGNCVYDSASELVQQYTFTRGFTIGNFCGKYLGAKVCSNTGYLQSASVSYERPNTTAALVGSHSGAIIPLTCLELHVTAPTGGVERVIEVTSSGEVAMNQSCP